jgi:hypothetical protein
MIALLTKILLALRSLLEVRASREAEILVLRQQLLVLGRKSQKACQIAQHRSADPSLAVSAVPVAVGCHGHHQT